MYNQVIVIVMVSIVSFTVNADAGNKQQMHDSNAPEESTTRTIAKEIKWKVLGNGRTVSPIYGDIEKGHHLTYLKVPAGAKTKPHKHSANYQGIVISGTARHYEPSKPETMVSLPAGSQWTVSKGIVHVSECISKNECIFVIHQIEKFDVKSAE